MNLPNELIVLLMAMLPLTELRASIPYGIAVLEMSTASALIFSLLGNTLISIIIIYLLPPATKFLRRHSKLMDRFFDKLFHQTRTRHTKRMSELGHIALVTFVAVPLPGSGGWTGSLVAHVFGINKKLSIPLIALGLIISGLIVTFGTEGIVKLLS
jgi:uncharacterized membrane protein